MDEVEKKYINIAKKCTCGLLAGVILCVSVIETECPIHGSKNCQAQHIEPNLVSLGTVNGSAIVF